MTKKIQKATAIALACVALGPLQAEARDWLGLPHDCREAVVKRALVDGLCISDSVYFCVKAGV